MHSEPPVRARPPLAGSLRFLTTRLVRAAHSTPGSQVTSCACGGIASRCSHQSPVQASPNPAGWPLPTSLSGPLTWLHLRCGSHRRGTGASAGRLLDRTADVATCVTGISHGELLTAHERGETSLTLRIERRNGRIDPERSDTPQSPSPERIGKTTSDAMPPEVVHQSFTARCATPLEPSRSNQVVSPFKSASS